MESSMFNRLACLALIASLALVCAGDNLGGFCFRAAVSLPLVWLDLISIETATAFVRPDSI
jgi:hypothetical protein